MTWGYSFRLGSAAAWFAEDAEDARDWLIATGCSMPRAASPMPAEEPTRSRRVK